MDKTMIAAVEKLAGDTADMVRVHRLTGMRPKEVCGLEWSRIDTRRTPWVYRPASHKNSWRGNPRPILIGPRAREVLKRHAGLEGAIFSPARAVIGRLMAKGVTVDLAAPRRAGDKWTTSDYYHTVEAACRRAKIKTWGPNRLRHTFATDVRREFGIDAARAVLGHVTRLRVTDQYSRDAAEEELIRAAAKAVEALG